MLFVAALLQRGGIVATLFVAGHGRFVKLVVFWFQVIYSLRKDQVVFDLFGHNDFIIVVFIIFVVDFNALMLIFVIFNQLF